MNVSYSPPSPQAWTPYFSESYHKREIESITLKKFMKHILPKMSKTLYTGCCLGLNWHVVSKITCM